MTKYQTQSVPNLVPRFLADFLCLAQDHGGKAKPVPRNNTPLDRYATASWQLATIRVDADNSLTAGP